MFNRKPKPGVLVRVTKERYEVASLTSTTTPTYRDRWLFALIQGQGGISDTVEPGDYVFNAKRKGLRVEISLQPYED